MANRPVFTALDRRPFFVERDIDFQYFSGFSAAQKRRCVESLHAVYLQCFPDGAPLEISTKSPEPLGAALSAFRLKIRLGSGAECPLECAFQGAKVFERGGPFADLLEKTPREARRDPRLRESGRLVGFRLEGTDYPAEPKTFFYDWLYLNAVGRSPELTEALLGYRAFTDIEFNPKKSLNCQARAAAICVSLAGCGLLEDALQSPEAFRRIVYGL